MRRWLPRFAWVGATTIGLTDDDDHVGEALVMQWGPLVLEWTFAWRRP